MPRKAAIEWLYSNYKSTTQFGGNQVQVVTKVMSMLLFPIQETRMELMIKGVLFWKKTEWISPLLSVDEEEAIYMFTLCF